MGMIDQRNSAAPTDQNHPSTPSQEAAAAPESAPTIYDMAPVYADTHSIKAVLQAALDGQEFTDVELSISVERFTVGSKKFKLHKASDEKHEYGSGGWRSHTITLSLDDVPLLESYLYYSWLTTSDDSTDYSGNTTTHTHRLNEDPLAIELFTRIANLPVAEKSRGMMDDTFDIANKMPAIMRA